MLRIPVVAVTVVLLVAAGDTATAPAGMHHYFVTKGVTIVSVTIMGPYILTTSIPRTSRGASSLTAIDGIFHSMITADLLSQISLFAPLPESERASLAARAADVRVRANEYLLVEGQTPAFFGLLEGRIDVWKTMGGHDERITTFGPGDYFGEIPLLLGTPSLASLLATEPARLMRLDGPDFLEMVSQCRVLSGEISRTMATRITRLQQVAVDAPSTMTTVIGHPTDPVCYNLREFLSRNRVPFTWRENGQEPPGVAAQAPTVILPDGRRLEAPSFRALADALGMQTVPVHELYDVAIVGGGPAGLAAAVYGASEGLRTLLVERTALGGQAGTSSRIENYLGFPGGLAGDELSTKAYLQARRFGAEMLVARTVVGIRGRGAQLASAACAQARGRHSRARPRRHPGHRRRVAEAGHPRVRAAGRPRGLLRRRARRGAPAPGAERAPDRWRELRRPGCDAVLELRGVGNDAGARAFTCGQHVAVSRRPARRSKRTSRWSATPKSWGSRAVTGWRRSTSCAGRGGGRSGGRATGCSCSSAPGPRPHGCRRP